MQTFDYTSATDSNQAIGAATRMLNGRSAPVAQPTVRFVAGGTTLIDLMKLDVEKPEHLIDINKLPLKDVETLPDGRLRIGALVRNADLANHPAVQRDYPVLSLALKSGASAQLRNMATTGGNLLQRTRCMYFRDSASACNKRDPGSGCAAIDGANRNLAILGTSEHCIASNPSDMNVALTALEATIVTSSEDGGRQISIADFFLLPGDTPERETVLMPGELITHVILPPPLTGAHATYLKLRDRASYEFALASAAVMVTVRNGVIDHARIAMGGVGTRPWRSREAEQALQGKPLNDATFAQAAQAAMSGARAQSQNGFKIELAKRCLTHALKTSTADA